LLKICLTSDIIAAVIDEILTTA